MKIVKNNNVSIKINELGAELKSFNVFGKEYIWYSDPKFWGRSAPFLFPIVGSIKDKKTIINGKEYFLSQHGFLRDQEFIVKNENSNYIEFENTYSEETLKLYPFKYKAHVRYDINDDSVKTSITITNLGEDIMPFNIGGHPAFNCPLEKDEKFSDYRIIFSKEESFASPKVCAGGLLDFSTKVYEQKNIKELQLNKEIFTIDTILITNVKSREVKLVNKNNKGIQFIYDDFSTLAIWTPYNEAPFICLEPWIGYNDKVDTNGQYLTKDNLVKLKKGESFTASYTIRALN